MTNYFGNKLKDRLTYCRDWKHSIDLHLANKEITKKADEEYYKTRPFLKNCFRYLFFALQFAKVCTIHKNKT